MNLYKNNRRLLCRVALAVAIASITGCALYSNGNFESYSGPNDFTGQGGTKRTVDGIDIWDTGSPPRHFRILGYIFQRNVQDNTALSVLANLDTLHEIVKQAKQVGGDAIIFEAQNNSTLGYSGNVDAYGNFDASPMTMTNSRIAVIKYIP